MPHFGGSATVFRHHGGRNLALFRLPLEGVIWPVAVEVPDDLDDWYLRPRKLFDGSTVVGFEVKGVAPTLVREAMVETCGCDPRVGNDDLIAQAIYGSSEQEGSSSSIRASAPMTIPSAGFDPSGTIPHGRTGRGTFSQPSARCEYPKEGVPNPRPPDARTEALPYAAAAGYVPRRAIVGAPVADQATAAKQVWEANLRPWLRSTARALIRDPLVWMGVGARIFFPQVGWVPLLAYGAYRGYEAVR